MDVCNIEVHEVSTRAYRQGDIGGALWMEKLDDGNVHILVCLCQTEFMMAVAGRANHMAATRAHVHGSALLELQTAIITNC